MTESTWARLSLDRQLKEVLRPVSNACRVGEHNAVVWKRLYFRPPAASFSKFGVCHGPPNALLAPKPTSSIRMTTTFGAVAGGRTSLIGG